MGWPTGANGTVAGVPYPNAWIRITRLANTFVAYWGTDGRPAPFLDQYSVGGLSAAPYVGMGVTSHDNALGHTAVAVLHDWFVRPGSGNRYASCEQCGGQRPNGDLLVSATGVPEGGPLSYNGGSTARLFSTKRSHAHDSERQRSECGQL